MPNYRKKNNNNRNKNKNNKNKSTSSSSVKQEIKIVESTTTTTKLTSTSGIEPNLPADVRNSYTTSAKNSVFEEKNVVVVVNVDEAASTLSPLSNEEIAQNASNVDIDTFSGSEDTNSILKQSNYSSTFYSSSTSSSSSCSKKSTEIEDRQLNRAVFDIGDSTLVDSVIRETFVKDASSGKNSLKTGSANSKDAASAVSAADIPPATTATTQSIEDTRINESVSEKVRDVTEQRSKSTESATEVIESNNQSNSQVSSSKEDQHPSKVIVHKVVVRNGSEKSMTHSSLSSTTPPAESSRVIVHQLSKEDQKKSQVIIHHEEESSSSSSHRASSSKNEVDLSKKVIFEKVSKKKAKRSNTSSLQTSTKGSHSSTTQTLSFSNVRGQPSRQIIYEPRKVILDNFSNTQGPSRGIIHQISREEDATKQDHSKVIVHQISREEKERTSSLSNESVITQYTSPQTTDYRLIVHQISPSIIDHSKNSSKPSSPRSAESVDQFGKVIDHSIFQQSFAENISKRVNIDQQDRFTQNVSKKDTASEGGAASDKNKKVVLIPILQENSTQTSPLSSFKENPLHSSLLEVIKDENNETAKSSNKSEISRQTSSSPLTRSPVICFENLSKSFELNKDSTEDHYEDLTQASSNNPSKVKIHPILQQESAQTNPTETDSQSSRKSPQKSTDHLEPLKIPAFPITRVSKVIIHPIINETSGKPVFPYSEKSMQSIDSSSKKIAKQILKEVSSELKSSFSTERTKNTMEEVCSEPIRTCFPVTLKNQASFRPGFFETNIHQKETNPLDKESKVIVHKILEENSNSEDLHCNESKSNANNFEEKVVVHEILKDLHIKETKLEENSYSSEINSQTSPRELKINPASTLDPKIINHQISREQTQTSHSDLKEMKDPSDSISKSAENEDKPKVILHQISISPSFPLVNETNGEHIPKVSKISNDSFPLSALKINHPEQYNSRSTILEQKTINFKKLRDESKLTQSGLSSTMTSPFSQTLMTSSKDQKTPSQNPKGKVINHPILQPDSESSHSSFPVSVKKQNQSSFISKPIFKDKSNVARSLFPISMEKETHASQYTSNPHDSQQKSIHLQSLRDSAELRQSSSTLASTFGLTEMENKKEIVHQILKEEPASDHQKQTSCQSGCPNASGSSFPISMEKETHASQYTSNPRDSQQKSIHLQSLRDSAELHQSSSTLTSTFGPTEMENKKEIVHTVLKEEPASDLQKQTSYQSGCPTASGSSFPISMEKETHASQYTSNPRDSQQKSIHLQSLRDSAELRQSSSTLTSTFGLTEMENKKEIVHQILKEEPPSDGHKQSTSCGSSFTTLSAKTPQNYKSEDQEPFGQQILRESSEVSESSSTKTSTISSNEMENYKNEPKEIIHQILKQTSANDLQKETSGLPASQSRQDQTLPKEIIHQIVKEDSSSDLQPKNLDHQTSQDESISSSEGSSVLTAILNESPRSISPPTAEDQKPNKESSKEKSPPKRSFFLAPLEISNKTQSQATEVKQDLQMISPDFVKVINHPIVRQIEKPLAYRVESPQPEKLPMIMKKSKSFDDDDVVIQEMSDTSSAGDTDNPPVISEAESETDTLEAVDDFPDTPSSSSSLLSVQTLPMDSESDNKSSQDYKLRRQQNRAALESHFLPQFLSPNFLDSIKEENSDLSDSDRRSSCSDRVDPSIQHGDLDDDVFLDPPKKANAVYPKSNLDFSKKHKHVLNVRPPKTSVIREEASPPSVVEAKIIDQGSVEESCSSWSTDLTPESEAAEVVYIDSASSSVSDLLELDYSQGQPVDDSDSIDVRIQTPTIDLESVNEMFATCQPIESNDRKIYNPPFEKPPPPPPVNDEQGNINEQNLLPGHNKNDLPDTTKLIKSENEGEMRKNEIIFQKIETMSETAAAVGDTHKNSDDVSAAATSTVRAENSIENNLNSCDSAIEQIVTSNTTPSVTAVSAAAAVVVVGSIENMENIREIVNASSKSELNTDQTDHGFSKPNFMIGQPCSDHTLKCDTTSSTSSTSSSSSSSTSSSTTTNTITTTTTKILTLHDLSQTLDSTKHLINPLVSPSSSSALDRQESLDSHGSDSTNQSQCTAINQGSLPHCDWNEFDTTTDTTYISESDTAAGLASSEASSPLTFKGAHTSGDETECPPIRKLRSLCTEALASMPYGEEVLQELATVSQNIREMPYPLPDLPQIKDIQLSLGSKPEKSSVITLSQVPPSKPATQVGQKFKSPPPPPIPEPPSKYDSWLGVPTESDPNVLVCLSPSQRNAVKSDSTADSLLDMHKKFVERRGYHEYTTKQVNAINQANTSEAPKLSKLDSPPPPPLPPRPQTQLLINPNGNTDINDNDDEEDQNNHRLLAIIRDTHENQQQQHQQKSSMTSTSENISRRNGESGIHHTVSTSTPKDGENSCLHQEFAKTPLSVNKQSQERTFIGESNKSHSSEMHHSESEHSTKNVSDETVMGMRFPTSEYFDSIFAGKNKHYSNIETGPEFCSQILATQPKRYSNIETSSFESQKCVENGKVLYDVSDSKREKISEGDLQPDSSSVSGTAFFPELSKPKTNDGLSASFPFETSTNRFATGGDSRPQTGGDSEKIMSAFKLNTTPQTTAPPPTATPAASSRVESSPPAPPVPPLPPTFTADTTATSSSMMTTKSTSTSESHINRTFNAKTSEKTFDDFGQHAKEAASTTTNESSSSTAKKPSDAFQHEKLFKEFDELSNLLNNELESGKRRPPATLNGNDIPSSVIDYNRVARESKIHNSHVSSTTSTETNRRETMKKLAEEIDRTSKQKLQQRREMRIPITIEKSSETGPRSAPILSQQPRSYEIPVQVENGQNGRPSLQHQRSYENPIRVERQSSNSSRQRTYSEHQSGHTTHEIPIQVEKPTPERFRRAESMFNISDSSTSRQHLHHDDWMKYVGDLGSSENICKPFQREVEICYLGRRPNIRAPRMSASTSDLSNIQTFDTHGAYDVRRTAQTPRPQQPPRRAYLSTHSLIDTTPITPCVSARRSPAPERRSSLPREIHDKQLQYITSKEQQLKYEFERLENERRHLIDEMNRVQMNQRISREAYRQRQLPPLTEDESFRQQMAEEWLNKVAEREERRLQKIIKISKVNQEAGIPVAPPRRHSAADDIGDEFLRRVKERRSKLCMPSDSDWESGAESQPLPRTDGSRSETDDPPATVYEGQSAANMKQLPKHLREFAKLTSQMKEEHREEMTENTSTSASKMTSLKTTVKTSSNNQHQHSSTHESQSMLQDGRYPYKANGYMSEPEPNYDSDYSTVKYRTLERRRLQSTGTTGTESRISAAPPTGNENQDETFYGTMPNPVKSGQGSYKVQPGRIENYITGHSSVSEKEKKEWWDEVMDIFNGQLDQQKLSPHYTEGNLSRALLKEQGYTSDSNLVFRKKDVPILQSPLSPVEQKQVYKSVQAGGQPPLLGFRKPAPEKPKESPNRYFESDVNIHYKTPIRYEYKDPIPEEELAIRQAETMQKLYQEERRRKYLQELQDMNSRRHTDNFTPSQKSPIPLNRYDDFNSDLAPKSPNTSNYPRTVARALYNFQGQTARELTFKKGDVIYIRRQIDKNWYEGEHNAMIGLLPSNYVELLTKDGIRQPPKKPSEGQARAKYNFQAQSGIELSLNKGEHVILTRRVDENWYEGKIANRKGIFPVSYVEVLVDIGAEDKAGRLPATQSIITQSSSSMRPSLDTLRTNINNEFNSLTSNGQPPNGILRETRTLHKTEVLHVDTNTEPVAYRALYKYRPQNTDELELQEGDVVFVLEKCDDGWFVGTSQRSGCFGTFPGNYVERV